MAVPAEFSILDISGKFNLNKSMSGDTDEMLNLQGIGWMKRKVIAVASVTLAIKHYKDEAGVERFDIDQTLTGGIPGAKEESVLNWAEKPSKSPLFGDIIGRARRCQVSELEDDFLKSNWTADTIEHGVIHVRVVSDTAKSGTSWTVNQVLGVQEINGQRRHARNVKFTGPKGENIELVLVYDWISSK
ncbi:hypothetical protein MSAN_02174800 [Mycena sanguinolenta]|uniref:LCCL domain-containing protein n=1 Tax=Mycena sanguinolenta TaxID=230812 RepID=A0A8H6XDY8_9AGAR|nr:hypothetical protein MSAN_02174800 [Mycena sanguinolenta]